jgi:hypothetical protein
MHCTSDGVKTGPRRPGHPGDTHLSHGIDSNPPLTRWLPHNLSSSLWPALTRACPPTVVVHGGRLACLCGGR